MSTGRATTEIDAGIASSVPFPARGPSLNPQATAFQPRPVQSRRQHSAATASRNKTTLSLRANVFFKYSSIRRLCDEAFQLALSPPPTKPPTNYEVGTTPLHPRYASLVTNFSTLFFDLASRRTPPLEPRALEDASAKHLTTIFASFAGAHVPCSCISAVAKDAAFPVLADTALRKAVSFPNGPLPNSWCADKSQHRRRRVSQEPPHPYWGGLLEPFRWAMLQLIWEERRERFAWRVAGALESLVKEEELREQLERGIRGAQEFELRRLRREWIGVGEG